ncbi:MAG: Crp/Fnr family transcriptional regulator [Proteobacteria bacterium]|nr:Crp/Fnr family transcriptional regulator [Pseudomonadota bacterium]
MLLAGQPLFHQGDPAAHLYSLTDGVIKLSTVFADGRRQVVAFHFPGEFISIDGSGRYHCTAEAVTRATLCRFAVNRFDIFAHVNPLLAKSRNRQAARDLAAAQTRMAILGQATAREKLAHFICDVHDRTRNIGLVQAHQVYLPMPRPDVADYLGLAKETVSREVTALKSMRIIASLSRTLLAILDLDRLRQLDPV